LLYDGSSAFHFREGFADALHGQLDLVRGSDVDQQNVVLPILHQLTQSRLELGATPLRKTTLRMLT
jgi:hypothetical protein